MAEGDTILRAARRIEAALGGERVRASAPDPRGSAAGVERLDARVLEKAEARGKNLLLDFGDLILHSHLGMSGSWRVYPTGGGRTARPSRLPWAVLEGSSAKAVQLGGPTLRVLDASALRRDPRLARLGPDLLAEGFETAAAIGRLRAAPGRAVGEAVLDQSTLAGIGNVFKSEAAFAARIDPWRPVGRLSDEELERLLHTAREQMLRSAAGGTRPRAVYRRAGRPCPVCGTPIAARGQGEANRATYWCPNCQRAPVSGFPGQGRRAA